MQLSAWELLAAMDRPCRHLGNAEKIESTIGKPEENGGFMGFDEVYALVIEYHY